MVRRAVLPLAAVVSAIGLSLTLTALSDPSRPVAAAPSVATIATDATDGAEIWSHDCATCHGVRGEGSFQGPSITEAGTAAVDFMVATGRMPAPFRSGISGGVLEEAPPTGRGRHDPAYTDEQRRALVAHTATFVTGPEAPDPPDLATADLARGGEVYRLQCSACHQMAGSGGALASGAVGPALDQATPVQVMEAVRTGPGNMPVFDRSVIDDGTLVDVAAYVDELRHPEDRGGAALWHLGPVPEGLVAWLFGIGGVLLLCRWLGERSKVDTR